MLTVILFTIVSLSTMFFPAVIFLSRFALAKNCDLTSRIIYTVLGSTCSIMFIYWSGFMADVMIITMQ